MSHGVSNIGSDVQQVIKEGLEIATKVHAAAPDMARGIQGVSSDIKEVASDVQGTAQDTQRVFSDVKVLENLVKGIIANLQNENPSEIQEVLSQLQYTGNSTLNDIEKVVSDVYKTLQALQKTKNDFLGFMHVVKNAL